MESVSQEITKTFKKNKIFPFYMRFDAVILADSIEILALSIKKNARLQVKPFSATFLMLTRYMVDHSV